MEKWLEKIDRVRKEQKLSIYKLTTQADLSENTIYNWYKKSSKPTVEALQAVCRALNISLSSLFATNEAETLNAQEEGLINDFRALSLENKALLMQLTRELSRILQKNDENSWFIHKNLVWLRLKRGNHVTIRQAM